MSVRQVFGRVDVTNESGGSADGETLNRHPNRQERIAQRLASSWPPRNMKGSRQEEWFSTAVVNTRCALVAAGERSLVKYPDFCVVLIVIQTGGRLEKHRTEGRISVHTLDGRIRFSKAERSVELAAGQMLTLEQNIPHDVEGVVDSAFLLTIA